MTKVAYAIFAFGIVWVVITIGFGGDSLAGVVGPFTAAAIWAEPLW